jgi:hypothetical protein
MNTAKPFARSACAVANSLDILGDKWSLLVVRDLLRGKKTYGELALSPERALPLMGQRAIASTDQAAYDIFLEIEHARTDCPLGPHLIACLNGTTNDCAGGFDHVDVATHLLCSSSPRWSR